MNGQIRIWFSDVKTQDEMEETLSQLRGFLEEVLIGHNTAKVELWVDRRIPPFAPAEAACEV